MANVKQVKSEALATIDAAMAILNKYPDLEDANTTLSFNTSTNPFQFLMDLFKSTTGTNKLISILAKFISYELPIVENGVKAVLIAKLKDIISCSVNPFFTEEILRNGVVFDVAEIDIADILRYSPFDNRIGKHFYFDTEEAEFPDDLTKCDDMNAFIWFMINKANRRYVWKPKKNRKDDEFRADYPSDENSEPTQQDIAEHYYIPLQELQEAYDGGEITQEEFDKQKQKLDKYYANYINNYNKLKKEDGIITLEYSEHGTNLKNAYGDNYYLQTPYNHCLHVFIGDVREKQTPISELKIQEDKFYTQEKDIKLYTTKIENKEAELKELEEERLSLEDKLAKNKIDEKEYKKQYKKLVNKAKNVRDDIESYKHYREVAYQVKRTCQYQIGLIKKQLENTSSQYFPFIVSNKNRNYYYGKSLIEFNIDYINSLTLFEEKTIAARLIDALTAVLTIDLHYTYKQQLVKNEIQKMISMITESDDLVISDCFFTFSNEEYDAMSRQAELRKAGLLTFNGDETSAVKIDAEKILATLNELNQTTNQEIVQTIIEGAITDISKELSDTTYEKTDNVNYGVQINLIENLLDSLAHVIVSSVLSPKVYLLLLINLKIIGRETNFDLEGFIGQYKQLIADIVRSVRDQLLNYLMREIMIIIGELVKEIALKLSIEQAKYYTRLIRKLIECFKKHGNKVNLDFNIDNVDYADILSSEEEEPKNNEC